MTGCKINSKMMPIITPLKSGDIIEIIPEFEGLGFLFFSLFRKVILVIPLTIFLPNLWDLGVYGVFYAEMISNFVGGIVCFSTMMVVVWRRLGK